MNKISFGLVSILLGVWLSIANAEQLDITTGSWLNIRENINSNFTELYEYKDSEQKEDDYKYFVWSLQYSDVEVTVIDGTVGIVVPEKLDGMVLIDAIASVSALNGVTDGETTVILRRVRAGVETDMLSAGITISYDNYSASDGIVDITNDDIATGDVLYGDITSVATAVGVDNDSDGEDDTPMGLGVTATFAWP